MVAIGAGIFSFIAFLLKLEKYCTLIPISVLEGFSFGVAITIGCGQFNFALGLNLAKKPSFFANLMDTFEHAGDLKANEFVPFLVMYLMLMSLKKIFPGKPWIIFIALVGMIYGFVTSVFFKEIAPVLLKDKYIAMQHPQLWNFEFLQNKGKIPLEAIVIGSAKVGFVAVLETLISARIADNLTGTRFD
tara:strand:- start:993 stop:1559 length:567 start_codon:yes stop_codon:yes gene_type:complete